jgi:type I restriction enzyme S subunit
MPEGWTSRPIRAWLADEFAGEWGVTPTNGGNATVLRSTDIDDEGHVDLDGGARRTIGASKLARKALRPGDILLEGSGGGPGKPVGRVALFRGSESDTYVCSNFFRTLRPSSRADPAFMGWLLQHFYRQPGIWAFQQQTTGIINLRFQDYAAATLSVPPLAEQRRIAEVLDTVDEAIRKTEEVIAKLELVKQGLLHDLLTCGIDDNGELRDPDGCPQQFKDSSLGRIPKAWTIRLLRDVAEIRSGIAKNSNRVVKDPVRVPYLRVANVQDGFLDLSEMAEIDVARTDLDRYRVLPGDVLMNEGGDLDKLGRGVLWRGEYDPCVHQNHVFVVRSSPEVHPAFLDAWTGAAVAKRYFMMAGKQTTNLASINKTALGGLPIALPSVEEQRTIAGRLAACDRRVADEEWGRSKLTLLKEGLMEDLLTGLVRVTRLPGHGAE